MEYARGKTRTLAIVTLLLLALPGATADTVATQDSSNVHQVLLATRFFETSSAMDETINVSAFDDTFAGAVDEDRSTVWGLTEWNCRMHAPFGQSATCSHTIQDVGGNVCSRTWSLASGQEVQFPSGALRCDFGNITGDQRFRTLWGGFGSIAPMGHSVQLYRTVVVVDPGDIEMQAVNITTAADPWLPFVLLGAAIAGAAVAGAWAVLGVAFITLLALAVGMDWTPATVALFVGVAALAWALPRMGEAWRQRREDKGAL